MSRFLLASGNLSITGSDGLRRFNSDDGLFHVVGSPINGSIAMGNLVSGDGQGFNRDEAFPIGTCAAGCTDIIGSIMISSYGGVFISTAGGLQGSTGIVTNVWVTMMGGSCFVIYQDGHSQIGSPDRNFAQYQFIYYYFDISGTTVRLRRRAWCSNQSQGSLQVNGHTVNYRLKAGLYT